MKQHVLCTELNWMQKTTFFNNHNVYANDVITCQAMDNAVEINELESDYAKFTISLKEYEIIASYINGWLCETSTEASIADGVLTYLMRGLNDKAFTIEDIKYEDSKVRDYINERIY